MRLIRRRREIGFKVEKIKEMMEIWRERKRD